MDEGRSVESSKVRPIIRTVVAVLLFLFYMFPFFMIVLNSFKDKRDITKLPLSFGGKKGFTIDNYITRICHKNGHRSVILDCYDDTVN